MNAERHAARRGLVGKRVGGLTMSQRRRSVLLSTGRAGGARVLSNAFMRTPVLRKPAPWAGSETSYVMCNNTCCIE